MFLKPPMRALCYYVVCTSTRTSKQQVIKAFITYCRDVYIEAVIYNMHNNCSIWHTLINKVHTVYSTKCSPKKFFIDLIPRQVPLDIVRQTRSAGRLPVVTFAAGGLATPADVSLLMQLGCDGVFVGSGIFKAWLPDGYRQVFRLYAFGHSGLQKYDMAPLCYATKCDPFLSLDCGRV